MSRRSLGRMPRGQQARNIAVDTLPVARTRRTRFSVPCAQFDLVLRRPSSRSRLHRCNSRSGKTSRINAFAFDGSFAIGNNAPPSQPRQEEQGWRTHVATLPDCLSSSLPCIQRKSYLRSRCAVPPPDLARSSYNEVVFAGRVCTYRCRRSRTTPTAKRQWPLRPSAGSS